MAVFQPTVLIPAIAVAARTRQLDKTHSALNQSAGNETLPPERFRVVEVIEHAVAFLSLPRLLLQVHQLRNGQLHASCQFIIGNRRFHLIVVPKAFQRSLIEFANEFQLASL